MMTMAAMEGAPARVERINAAEWLVWLTLFLMLGAGLILRGWVEDRSVRFSREGVTLASPDVK